VTGQDFVATTQLDFSIETKTRAGFLNIGGVSCGVGEELPKIEFSHQVNYIGPQRVI
jgi:hypothetical protein